MLILVILSRIKRNINLRDELVQKFSLCFIRIIMKRTVGNIYKPEFTEACSFVVLLISRLASTLVASYCVSAIRC